LKKKIKFPVTFNVSLYKRKEYFKVHVTKTRKEMFDMVKERSFIEREKDLSNYYALFQPFEKFNCADLFLKNRTNYIGNIFYYDGSLGPAIIAHELTHAAMWAERIIYKNTNCNFGEYIDEREERMIDNQTSMMIKTCRQLWKTGLWL